MSISQLCFPYNKHKELDTGVVAFIANAIFFVGVFTGLLAFLNLIITVGLLTLGFEHSTPTVKILLIKIIYFLPSFLFIAISALIWSFGRLVESLLLRRKNQ
tara:strand:+ start:1214 stop:1519 length:306 start_codon:yes stop_codon:yes gene_type:complete